MIAVAEVLAAPAPRLSSVRVASGVTSLSLHSSLAKANNDMCVT